MAAQNLDNIHTLVNSKIIEYETINAGNPYSTAPGKYEAYMVIKTSIENYKQQMQNDFGFMAYAEKHKKVMQRGEKLVDDH
jgi:hypothetical protein